MRRDGNWYRLIQALLTPPVGEEFGAALGGLLLFPSWALVLPFPWQHRTMAVRAEDGSESYRLYLAPDPVGSLYKPYPFFVCGEDHTLLFHIGLVESTLSFEPSSLPGILIATPDPVCAPLEPLYLRRGRRAWELSMSTRDGAVLVPEEYGETVTVRYRPMAPPKRYRASSGDVLEWVPLQYYLRGMARLLDFQEESYPQSVWMMLDRIRGSVVPVPAFGIGAALRLVEYRPLENALAAQDMESAVTGIFSDDGKLVHILSDGEDPVRLPALDSPRRGIWLLRHLALRGVERVRSVPGMVPAHTPSARWYGIWLPSDRSDVNGMAVISRRYGSYRADGQAVRGALPVGEGSVWPVSVLAEGFIPGYWWNQPLPTGYDHRSIQAAFVLYPDRRSLYSFGWSSLGQAGQDGPTGSSDPVWGPEPLDVTGNVIQIASGGSHSLILTSQRLYACGSNRYGQFGNGSRDSSETKRLLTDVTASLPQGVSVSDIRQVAAAPHYSVLVTYGGNVYVCGGSAFGALGLSGGGTLDDPVTGWQQVSALSGIRSVCATVRNLYAVTGDGALKVAGDNTYGQMAVGDTDPHSGWNTADTSGCGAVYRVAADASDAHATLLIIAGSDFAVWGCGSNLDRRLSGSGTGSSSLVRVSSIGSGPWSEIVCGASRMGGQLCGWVAALHRDGTVTAWGNAKTGIPCNSVEGRSAGQLDFGSRVVLVNMDGVDPNGRLLRWSRSLRSWFWAIDVQHRLWVWGDTSFANLPFAVPQGSDESRPFLSAQQVSHASIPGNTVDGGELGLVVTDTGVLMACGYDRFGATGTGSTGGTYSGWTAIAASGAFDGLCEIAETSGWSTCVLDRRGNLLVAGANHTGQLGIGSGYGNVVDEFVPVMDWDPISGVRQILLVRNTDTDNPLGWMFVVDGSGRLYAAGWNESGQLGVGDPTTVWTLTRVSSVSDVVRVCSFYTTGGGVTFILTQERKLYFCGSKHTGGDGSSGWGASGNQRTPFLVSGLPQGHIVDVVCAGLDPEQGCGVLALDDSGYVWAWGLDAYGELGSLHLSEPINTPTKVYRIGVDALGIGAVVGCSLIVSNALGVEGTGCCANGTAAFGGLPATTTFVPWGFPTGTAGEPVTAGAIFGGGNHLVVMSANGGTYCSGTVPFPLASGTVPSVVGGLWRFRVDALRPALST